MSKCRAPDTLKGRTYNSVPPLLFVASNTSQKVGEFAGSGIRKKSRF